MVVIINHYYTNLMITNYSSMRPLN